MFKVASFNVNSIRVRLDSTISFMEENKVDVLGMQETKVEDIDFPDEVFYDRGFEVEYHGQKTHYGVAISSLEPNLEIHKGFPTDDEEAQKRIIYGRFKTNLDNEVFIINGYFPQGESIHHETKFSKKMKFYDDLINLLKTQFNPQANLILMGDLNISPEDKDVGIGEKNAKQWLQTGKCSFLPEERARIDELREWGLFDTFRELNPDVSDRFSWFDFRSSGFSASPKMGLRIDQIWVTKPLMEKCKTSEIDYKLRGGERPSDHCPISADFDI